MRRLVAYELLSLDGVAEEPLEFMTDWDEAMTENLAGVIATQDSVLLGRRTYEEWAAFWPGSEIEPFSSFINRVEKLVVSSKDLDLSWRGSRAMEAPLAENLAQLKRGSGGDIGLHGSIELTQALLSAGVVDELRLVIAPTLRMQGRRLFTGHSPAGLRLKRIATSPSGCLMVDYDMGI